MVIRLRNAALLVVLLFATDPLFGAATDPATGTSDPAAPPAWNLAGSARASAGWADNVLLSPFAPIARGFGRLELEGFATWAHSDWEFISFLSGDALRYFSPPPETDGEDLWFAHGEMRWQHWPAWRVTTKVDGFFQDAVIDLSETETVRTIAPARVTGGFATLATRVALPGGFSIEPLAQVKRSNYHTFAGDYDETRAGARLEWKRSDRLGLSVAWHDLDRDYADRPQYTAGGRALAGTRLTFRRRSTEARLTTAWTRGASWEIAVTAGWLENRDRASGFFDYDQRRGRLEINWERDRWSIGLDGEAARLDYLVQTVGTGIAPPPRIADNFETTLQVERELTGPWSVLARHRWERSRSNETGFSYRATTILAGLQRTF